MICSDKMWSELAGKFAPAEIPALTAQYEEWLETRPLEGMRILDATPLFFNTCVKHTVLLAGGAELVCTYGDRIPYDPAAVAFLQDHDVDVAQNIYEDVIFDEFDCVLDCGAVHASVPSVSGAVELTRSGVTAYEEFTDKNVFLVDSGRIKKMETVFGTGESCLRALRQLGYTDFAEKNVLLFGYGKVGRGIAMYMRKAGAVVTVAELETGKGDLSILDREAVCAAIRDADFIITATGRKDALAVFGAELMKSNAVLVNMGFEDEFGNGVPAERCLNNKIPLNFILSEPTLTRYIDPVLALHNMGALILKDLPEGTGAVVPEDETEEKILEPVRAAGILNDELDQLMEGKI